MKPTKSPSKQDPTSRRGHPQRVGSQLLVRQLMWKLFDFIEKKGNYGLYREIADTLEDELVARGLDGDLAEMCGATPHYNRHEGN